MTTSRIPGKSPGIKTMQKETVSNNSCRICRIDLKIRGWSNMNALDITLSSVLSRSDVDDTMRLSQKICQKCEWEVLKFWIGKIQGKMLWGTKKSVGKLPLEMTEALREWFSGVVSRPTEKKYRLYLSCLSLSEEHWFQRKQLKRRIMNCGTLPHVICSSMVARKPESSCDRGRIAWCGWLWNRWHEKSTHFSFFKLKQIAS